MGVMKLRRPVRRGDCDAAAGRAIPRLSRGGKKRGLAGAVRLGHPVMVMPPPPITPLVVGDVRASSHNGELMRVVAFDEIEALYETWFFPGNCWGFPKSLKKRFYTFSSTAMLECEPRQRVEPLTEKELAAHRPDLPLRLCRHRALNWAQMAEASPSALENKLLGLGVDITKEPALTAPTVSLVIIGPTDSASAKQEAVLADGEGRIAAINLLWKAGQMFAARGMEVDDGIGLYRMGTWGGWPSYLLWGYHRYSTWVYEEKQEARLMPEWGMRRKAVSDGYVERLKAMKRQLPFKSWREKAEGGLEQYSKENCAAMTAIFDRLLKRLTAVGEGASEADKLAAFQEAIEATNELNAQEMNLIETGERDELCELCNEIARAAGLDPTKYGDGEGPASIWRDW
jgi:hypothetical protein